MKNIAKHYKTETDDSHQELIERCKRGDPRAQFKIYKVYYKMMFVICFWIVNDPREVEKIVKESFLKAFESLDAHNGTYDFVRWLGEIVIKRSLTAVENESHLNSEEEYLGDNFLSSFLKK